MYIVRNEKTKIILHTNSAPIKQGMEGKDVYHLFDINTMEIGKTDAGYIPEYFDIDTEGYVIDTTLREKMASGVLQLEPGQKILNNQVVEKTPEEKLAEGLIKLQPEQVLIDGEIIEKTLEEQLAEGLLKLEPRQKIANNQIVDKTLEEQVAEGVVTLDEPFEQLINGEIVQKTVAECVSENLIQTLEQCDGALKKIGQIIERKIFEQIGVSDELKRTKAYMDWLKESQPDNDPREQGYLEMQNTINLIKEEYSDLKRIIKLTRSEIEQSIT